MATTDGSRRDLMGTAALGGLAALGARAAFGQARRTLKVGLVGCGGRGVAALGQQVEAARVLNDALGLGLDVQVTALADYLPEKLERPRQKFDVPKAQCFSGADGYRKLLDTDVDLVLLCTPPAFRPVQFEAAVEAGKHVFLEKPAAVDPPGCRRVIAAAETAKQKGLMVVAGTQRRVQRGYVDTQAAVAEGAIGRILSGQVCWCQRHAGARERLGQVTLDRFLATWRDWAQLGGDHIVDQHIHNIDVANWFLGSHPVAAVGFGGRVWRPAGNAYDFFSIDFEYPEPGAPAEADAKRDPHLRGIHIHSMCRQIDECLVWIGERLVGEHAPKPHTTDPGQEPEAPPRGPRPGTIDCRGGLLPTKPVVPRDLPQRRQPHLQVQINLLYYLAKDQILNQAKALAESTATAILGRTAAYTGQRVEWRDMMDEPTRKPDLYNLTLHPTAEEIEQGDVDLPKEADVPKPGKAAS